MEHGQYSAGVPTGEISGSTVEQSPSGIYKFVAANGNVLGVSAHSVVGLLTETRAGEKQPGA